MADPQPPKAPDDAPQDLKDFLECKGLVLKWKPGKVNWLGLPVDPDVSFEAGAKPGTIDLKITIGSPPFGLSFSLPATVGWAGELSIDTSKIPDAVPGKAGLDQWITDLNGWFKHNGKKLKPPVLKGGVVTLEKTPIVTIGPPGPLTPSDLKWPVPPPPVTSSPTPGTTPAPGGKADDKKADEKKADDKKADDKPAGATSGPGCLGIIILVLILLLGAFGAVATGALRLGGPAATETPSSSEAATGSPQATLESTPTPTATAAPIASATATAAASASAGEIDRTCVIVVHKPLNQFVSYLDWSLRWTGGNVVDFALTVKGANDDQPVLLKADQQVHGWRAVLGLHQAGQKTIVQLLAHLGNGTIADVTNQLTTALGGSTFTVRFPEQDTFGDCSG